MRKILYASVCLILIEVPTIDFASAHKYNCESFSNSQQCKEDRYRYKQLKKAERYKRKQLRKEARYKRKLARREARYLRKHPRIAIPVIPFVLQEYIFPNNTNLTSPKKITKEDEPLYGKTNRDDLENNNSVIYNWQDHILTNVPPITLDELREFKY